MNLMLWWVSVQPWSIVRCSAFSAFRFPTPHFHCPRAEASVCPTKWLVQPRPQNPWPSQWKGLACALARLLTLRSCRKVQSDRSRLVAAVLRSFADLASLKARHCARKGMLVLLFPLEELWEDADTSLCLYVSQDVWKPLLGQRPLVMERFSVFRLPVSCPHPLGRVSWGAFFEDPVNPFCNLLDGAGPGLVHVELPFRLVKLHVPLTSPRFRW